MRVGTVWSLKSFLIQTTSWLREFKSQVDCNVKAAQHLKQSTHIYADGCPASFESRVNDHGTSLKKCLCRDSCNLIFWMRKYEGTWHRHFFHSYQRSNEFSCDEFGQKSEKYWGRKGENNSWTPWLHVSAQEKDIDHSNVTVGNSL